MNIATTDPNTPLSGMIDASATGGSSGSAGGDDMQGTQIADDVSRKLEGLLKGASIQELVALLKKYGEDNPEIGEKIKATISSKVANNVELKMQQGSSAAPELKAQESGVVAEIQTPAKGPTLVAGPAMDDRMSASELIDKTLDRAVGMAAFETSMKYGVAYGDKMRNAAREEVFAAVVDNKASDRDLSKMLKDVAEKASEAARETAVEALGTSPPSLAAPAVQTNDMVALGSGFDALGTLSPAFGSAASPPMPEKSVDDTVSVLPRGKKT